jgi:isopentenyl-diphosphate delta-isomerase
MAIDERKNDHIDICLEKDVRTTVDHWDDVFVLHQAIPSLDLAEIDLSASLLGKKLNAPLVISAMTGGSSKAGKYNELLAKAASEFQIGLGVGSQRAGIEKTEHVHSYSLVKEYDIPLVLGNIGAPQISRPAKGEKNQYRTLGPDDLVSALEMVSGDGICIHLNYLQEAVQPEGETIISGLLENIKTITSRVPVVAKETGAGISREAAIELKEAGVKAIDVGGASGTSFAAVESYRRMTGSKDVRRIGRTYWDWGIPTPVSVRMAQVGLPIIATGGIRNGLDVTRAISIGADVCGMAWPILMAASEGYDELRSVLASIIEEIRIGLFLSGAESASQHPRMRGVITGRSREILDSLYPG